MPISEQKKMRNSGGDTVAQKSDQLNLWYLIHRAQRIGEDRMSLNFPEAVDLSEDDVMIISDTEDAEGVCQQEDEDPMKLPMDLNQGCPDYRTMWIAGAQFKNKSGTLCSAAKLCGQSHLCLRCRARDTRMKYTQWEITDQRVAAHVLFQKRKRHWKPLHTDGIWEYLMDLEENLMNNQPLQKELSHLAGVRVPDEVFMRTAIAEQLTYLEIWEATVDGDIYYLATRDPTNKVYAAWLYNVAKGINMPFNNCEELGDVVEAGLGLLYLA
jgi:hypothetical protein